MSNFKFKGSSGSSSEVLKVVNLGGSEMTIYKDNYTGRNGNTMYTIRVEGAGKPKRMGPQAALAIIEAQEAIIEYFKEAGVIE